MHGSLVSSSALLAGLATLGPVSWAYFAGGSILAIGLVAIVLRGDAQKARGFDRLILLGPLFFAAPIAAFGTEHFTVGASIEPIMPEWIPWHRFWIYFVGACLIAAALSLATKIQARLAAVLLGVTFFLFVALMHAPAWAREPGDRFILAIVLREIAFSGGALALAGSLTDPRSERTVRVLKTVARYFIAVPVLFFAFQQFMHGGDVPAVPLDRRTPDYVYGHAVWTYLAAAVYAVAGTLLLAGKKTRAAATWLGVCVLLIELVVYVPIGIVERSSLGNGLNYVADTLMFGGAVLLLAGAMPEDLVAASHSA